ncbi:MAG: hypothetical protein HN936_13905 [Bacteroidetes bacterium]|nr:hypothetical protein [Bacteroidota bacterium]MBT7094336.1 hypothetical protein [Bacteroidota bacterium]MBT7462749.1 hypothetical protein [Bacteroidota bacterium]
MNNQKRFNQLEIRLSRFRRKYYFNQMFQGILIGLLSIGLPIAFMVVINQFFSTGSDFRTIAFMLIIGIALVQFLAFAVLPFLKGIGVFKGLSLRKREKIIRVKFPEIEDLLLNVIELRELVDEKENIALLEASIDEKCNRLKWYRFDKAVPFKRLVLPGVMIVSLMLIFSLGRIIWPEFVSQGYAKTIHYNQDFEENNLIGFRLLNSDLKIGMGEDLKVTFEPIFKLLSENIYLKVGESYYSCENDKGIITYLFEAVNGSFSFSIVMDDFQSEIYFVEVIPTPELIELQIKVDAPAYTKLKSIVESGGVDLNVAEGSIIQWSLESSFTNNISLLLPTDTVFRNNIKKKEIFRYRAVKSGEYVFNLKSDKIETNYELAYELIVNKDEYPGIEASQVIDTIFTEQVYFQANIQDDYGFSKASFTVKNAEDGSIVFEDSIRINRDVRYQRVYYAIDFEKIGLEGMSFSYYLSIWDNDGINGAKRSDSRLFTKRRSTADDRFNDNRERGAEVEEKLSDSKELVEDMQDRLNKLINSQITDEKDDWEIKNKVEEISDMKNVLEEMIDNIREENKMINISENIDGERREEIIRKQEEIEELFENMLDDELRKLFEEFKALAEEMNKKDRLEKSEELKMNLENLERQLEVNLELLKKLELEKKIYDLANQIKKLGEKTEKEAKDENAGEIKKEFEKIERKLDEQLKDNEELEKPHDLDKLKEERESIKDKLDEAEKKTKKEKSSSEMKDAGKKMKDMAAKLQNMMSDGGSGQNSIDIEILRQLSRELNDFSFEQEELLSSIQGANARSSVFHEIGKKQKDLDTKFRTISDSLKSLGYRQAMIAQLLNQELFHVETSFSNLFRNLQEGRVSQVRYEQQKVMEGVNELAVRLDELINSLQAMSGEGQGSNAFTDSKPKDGGEEVGEMRSKQESLKEQLKGMIQKMKSGQGGKDGNKELAKMLAEREMMRKALEDLKNGGTLGQKTKEKLNDVLNMMDEVEKDIIYKRLSDNTLAKDEWIQTRLLEAEKAEKEREEDNIRKATEFKGELKADDPEMWKEYNRVVKRQQDIMKYQEIKLKEYYKKKYLKYLEILEREEIK